MHIEIQYVVIAGLVSLFVAWLVRRYLTRPGNLPPGPSTLDLLQVALSRKPVNPLKLFSSWADTYGDIFSINLGPVTIVMLNSIATIQEAFHNIHLTSRPTSTLLDEAIGLKLKGISYAYGQEAKELRHFTHTVLRSFGVGKKSFEETISVDVRKVVDAFEKKGGRPFDPHDILCAAVSNVISGVAFGKQFEYEEPEFVKVLDLVRYYFQLIGAGGILLFLPIPGISKFPGSCRQITKTIQGIDEYVTKNVEEHKREVEPDNPRDFIDMYLMRMKEDKVQGKDTKLDEKNLRATLIDLINGGADTTSTLLSWVILYMMEYPDVQSHVQKELDQVIGRDRLPRLDDRKNLPYTNAVMIECMRLADIVPITPPHMASESTTVMGYHVPKGTFIMANLSRVTHNSQWDAPYDFNPDRFLLREDTAASINDVRKNNMILFGTGPRTCPGEQLARKEIFLFLSGLLHQFTFRKPDCSPPLSFEGVLGVTRNTGPYETCAIRR